MLSVFYLSLFVPSCSLFVNARKCMEFYDFFLLVLLKETVKQEYIQFWVCNAIQKIREIPRAQANKNKTFIFLSFFSFFF